MEEHIETEQALDLGASLAAERERQGLSRSEVAQRLHMSVSQVDAIESGEYSRLPKGPFLRGFVRNYSKVLGVDPEAMLGMLGHGAQRDAAPTHIVVPSQNIRFGDERLSNSPYVKATVVGAVVVALGFAGMYWWIAVRPSPPARADSVGQLATPKSSDMPPPQQIAAPPAQVEAPKNEPPPVPSEPPRMLDTPKPAEASPGRQAAATGTSTPAAAPAITQAASTARVPGERALRFRFRGESWVEVRDARGKVLASGVNAAGSEAQLAGKPPFTVVVGNAPDVTLFYNDREFPMEPHTKVAVARFTLE